MGYATTFYAVDLDALRRAVGGKDAALANRVIAAIRQADGAPADDDLRVVVRFDDQIELDGTALAPDAFAAALRNRAWAGRTLRVHERRPATPEERRQKRAGRFAALGSFSEFLHAALAASKVRYAGISSCSTEADLYADGDDELSLEAAVLELIAGRFTDEDSPHQYGYALERLCETLGARLGTIEGKGRHKNLKLASPLFQDRPPVKLPANDDFPYISHLTADEVRAEAARLAAADLSDAKNPDAAAQRRQFAALHQTAADQGRAIVSFYY